MATVADKAEFYQLSRQFVFGNRLRQWTWAEFRSRYNGGSGNSNSEDNSDNSSLPLVVGIRSASGSRRKLAGKYPLACAWAIAKQAPLDERDQLFFDEGAPHRYLTLQGEVLTDHQGLYLRYSHAKLHQRRLWEADAARHWLQPALVFHARGLQASLLLRRYLDDMSLECINTILAEYADAIVEFSAFSKSVGVLGWNSVIWEVRTCY
jgi:hypothetical protein